jgi:tetratricopeptide (TPR) repeat protein
MSDEFQRLLREGLDQLTEGRVSESRDTFLKVIRHSSEIGDRASLADAFSGLAEAESDIGNLPAAEHIYSNAAALYRELGDSPLTRTRTDWQNKRINNPNDSSLPVWVY